MMDPEYHEQELRLRQLRRSLQEQDKQNTTPAVGSTREIHLGENSDQDERTTKRKSLGSSVESEPLQDPLIFPDLYSPSGFDMMGILIRVRTRPNPVINIGNIDSSVALVLCDSAAPDFPIVYCSESFETLTGYSSAEILGRNCRFLQHPYQSPLSNVDMNETEIDPKMHEDNEKAKAKLRQKIAKGEEAQVRLLNYTKSGAKFYNLLTTIPITWDEGENSFGMGKRYIVGFQADWRAHFG